MLHQRALEKRDEGLVLFLYIWSYALHIWTGMPHAIANRLIPTVLYYLQLNLSQMRQRSTR
jgi:hypothetical protein